MSVVQYFTITQNTSLFELRSMLAILERGIVEWRVKYATGSVQTPPHAVAMRDVYAVKAAICHKTGETAMAEHYRMMVLSAEFAAYTPSRLTINEL